MENYVKTIQIRWADIDQNRHLRHSVYYDYGAMVRIFFLSEHGLTSEKMEEFNIGPIIFREEALFKREIRLEDLITVDVELVKTTSDYSRWTLRHRFAKEDGTIAAVLTLDGAWIDTEKRKLTIPNQFIQEIFAEYPKSDAYEMLEKKSSE